MNNTHESAIKDEFALYQVARKACARAEVPSFPSFPDWLRKDGIETKPGNDNILKTETERREEMQIMLEDVQVRRLIEFFNSLGQSGVTSSYKNFKKGEAVKIDAEKGAHGDEPK